MAAAAPHPGDPATAALRPADRAAEGAGLLDSSAPGARPAGWGILLLLPLGFLLLAIVYGVVVPPWEAPDEPGHVAYVRHLREQRALPLQTDAPTAAHQPPLYYLAAALASLPAAFDDESGFRPNPAFVWAGGGGRDAAAAVHTTAETFPYAGTALALHLMRALSALLGAAAVGLTIAIARDLAPDRRDLWVLAGGLVAFNPQVLFVHAAVTNDALVTALGAGATWSGLRALRRPEASRRWFALGLWLGLAFLAKTTVIGVGLGLAAAALGVVAARHSPLVLVRAALFVSTPFLLIAGPWLARNQRLYGDPLGQARYAQVWAVNVRSSPLTGEDLLAWAEKSFVSAWGVFGWMNVYPPKEIHLLAAGLTLLALIGLVVGFARAAGSRELVALGAVVAGQIVFHLLLIRSCNDSCFQGRYLFPAAGAAATLLAAGLLALVPRRAGAAVAGAIVLALLGIALAVPWWVIAPAYPRAVLSRRAAEALPRNIDVEVGEHVRLIGYRVRQVEERLIVTLYWQARTRPPLDYSAFVHVIDEAGTIVAQKDHPPGAGLGRPPTAWWPGDVIADEHEMSLEPARRAATARLRVGLYDWRNGEQLPLSRAGQPSGTFLVLPLSEDDAARRSD